MGLNLWVTLGRFLASWLGKFPRQPGDVDLSPLLGARWAVASLLSNLPYAMLLSLTIFFLFFLLRVLLRNDWIAATVFVLIFSLPQVFGDYPVVDTVRVAIFYLGLLVVLKRFGLVPMVVGFISQSALIGWPLTTHLTTWLAGSTLLALALVLVLAIYGFHMSLAGRPIFSGAALDD